MKPTLMNIRERAKNTEYYDRTRDMEVALAWNSIKKTLQEVWREELFAYIKSVRLTEKSVVITTEKPIVNEEIRNYRGHLLRNIIISLESLRKKSELKLIFR